MFTVVNSSSAKDILHSRSGFITFRLHSVDMFSLAGIPLHIAITSLRLELDKMFSIKSVTILCEFCKSFVLCSLYQIVAFYASHLVYIHVRFKLEFLSISYFTCIGFYNWGKKTYIIPSHCSWVLDWFCSLPLKCWHVVGCPKPSWYCH